MSRKQLLAGASGKKEKQNTRKENKNKSLNLKTIEIYLKSSPTYLGAIYSDSFKHLTVKHNRFSIVVYCKHHWFCLYCTAKTFEIFDPLGFLQKIHCTPQSFFHFLQSHIQGKVLYSNPQIQAKKANTCGYYVILFICLRDMGYSYFDILNLFSNNFPTNDKRVKELVSKLKHKK